MNCRHITRQGTINSEKVLEALRKHLENKSTHDHATGHATGVPNEKLPGCAECGVTKERWMCLHCGQVHCGRYIQGHARAHVNGMDYLTSMDHSSALELDTNACYCFICDEEIQSDKDTVLSTLCKSVADLLRPPEAEAPSNGNPPPQQGANASSPEKGKGRKKAVGRAKKFAHLTGLSNLGNTCFLNAIMQTICHTVAFQPYYLDWHPAPPHTGQRPDTPSSKGSHPSTPSQSPRLTRRMSANKDISIWAEVQRLLREMWTDDSVALTPSDFHDSIGKLSPTLGNYQQQDAQEFLRCLLDRLHTEMSLQMSTTPITRVFQGTLDNEVKCLRCGGSSVKCDPFLDLSLPIPERFLKRQNKVEQMLKPCTVEECLRAFTEIEQLADSERYSCPPCIDLNRGPQRCTKRLSIHDVPEVLCLHLKRFRHATTSRRSNRSKIDTYVKFPLQGLNMGPYTTLRKNAIYDLYSVVVHHGSSISGHYMAYIWSPHHGSWFEVNDTSIKPVQPALVAEQEAYLLFYVRRNGAQEEDPGTVLEEEEAKSSSSPALSTASSSAYPPPIPLSQLEPQLPPAHQPPIKIRIKMRNGSIPTIPLSGSLKERPTPVKHRKKGTDGRPPPASSATTGKRRVHPADDDQTSGSRPAKKRHSGTKAIRPVIKPSSSDEEPLPPTSPTKRQFELIEDEDDLPTTPPPKKRARTPDSEGEYIPSPRGSNKRPSDSTDSDDVPLDRLKRRRQVTG